MLIRTYLRTMFNKIFYNNVIVDFCRTVVKFCNNLPSNKENFLKFSENMPLDKMDTNEKFSFQSITGDKIDYKNIKICYKESENKQFF